MTTLNKESTIEREHTYESVKEWLEQHVHKTFKDNCEEYQVMNSILKLHPNYESWKNKNVQAFKITRSKKNKALQVCIKMKSESHGDKHKNDWRIVSWVACAKGKLPKKMTVENQLTQAMRYAIRVQINNWRNNPKNAYNPKCVLCEESNRLKLEVDHYPIMFSTMRDDFIKDNAKCLNLSLRWDNKNTSFRFQSKEPLNAKWQRYHKKYAEYRWLCGDCNKKMNRKVKNK